MLLCHQYLKMIRYFARLSLTHNTRSVPYHARCVAYNVRSVVSSDVWRIVTHNVGRILAIIVRVSIKFHVLNGSKHITLVPELANKLLKFLIIPHLTRGFRNDLALHLAQLLLINDNACRLIILEFSLLVCWLLLVLIVVLCLLILIELYTLRVVLSRQKIRSWCWNYWHITSVASFYVLLRFLLSDTSIHCKRIIPLMLWMLWTCGREVNCGTLLLVLLFTLLDLIPQRAKVVSDLIQFCSVMSQIFWSWARAIVSFHIAQHRLFKNGDFLFILV